MHTEYASSYTFKSTLTNSIYQILSMHWKVSTNFYELSSDRID